ncbi:flagellar hook-length control protein FliK [Xylophilus sp. GW821-FHT01B05]
MDAMRAAQGNPQDVLSLTEVSMTEGEGSVHEDASDASGAELQGMQAAPAMEAFAAMQSVWWREAGQVAAVSPEPAWAGGIARGGNGAQSAITPLLVSQGAASVAMLPAEPTQRMPGLFAESSSTPSADVTFAQASPLQEAQSPRRGKERQVETLSQTGTLPSLREQPSRETRTSASMADGSRSAVTVSVELQASASPLAPEAGLRAKEAAPAELAARQPALMQALGERIKVQIAQGSERAVIRLDPPMMGRLEIVIRHEAGVLQVQLHASHSEVVRQLQQMSDGLRQELGQRQFSDVSVLVSHGSERESAGRQRNGQDQDAPDPAPGRALAEAEAGHEHSLFTLA